MQIVRLQSRYRAHAFILVAGLVVSATACKGRGSKAKGPPEAPEDCSLALCDNDRVDDKSCLPPLVLKDGVCSNAPVITPPACVETKDRSCRVETTSACMLETVHAEGLSSAVELPLTCPDLPELAAPEASFAVTDYTVAEIRDEQCHFYCAALMLNANTAMASSTCLAMASEPRRPKRLLMRVRGTNYKLARGPECLPHQFSLDQKGQPSTLMGGQPLAFLTLDGSVKEVKSPVNTGKTENENRQYSHADIWAGEDALEELFWTGSRVIGIKSPQPRDYPSHGTQLVFTRNPQCHFQRSLGLHIHEGDSRYMFGVPLYRWSVANDCHRVDSAFYSRIDHVLSREALNLKLR